MARASTATTRPTTQGGKSRNHGLSPALSPESSACWQRRSPRSEQASGDEAQGDRGDTKPFYWDFGDSGRSTWRTRDWRLVLASQSGRQTARRGEHLERGERRVGGTLPSPGASPGKPPVPGCASQAMQRADSIEPSAKPRAAHRVSGARPSFIRRGESFRRPPSAGGLDPVDLPAEQVVHNLKPDTPFATRGRL